MQNEAVYNVTNNLADLVLQCNSRLFSVRLEVLMKVSDAWNQGKCVNVQCVDCDVTPHDFCPLHSGKRGATLQKTSTCDNLANQAVVFVKDEFGEAPNSTLTVLSAQSSTTYANACNSNDLPEVTVSHNKKQKSRLRSGTKKRRQLTTEQLPKGTERTSDSEQGGVQTDTQVMSIDVCQLLLGCEQLPADTVAVLVKDNDCEDGEKVPDGEEECKLELLDGIFETVDNTDPFDKTFACTHCGKRFEHVHKLAEHVRRHTGEKPYECSVCNKRFVSNGALTKHSMIHARLRSFTCEVCGQLFTQKAHMMRHLSVHTGARPYVCKVCGKRFTQNDGLKRHTATHSGVKSFLCGLCGRLFLLNKYYRRHMKVHTDERPRSCHQCGKCFSDGTYLRRHMHVHTGNRPFACKRCGRQFTEQGLLNKHERLYSGDRPCRRASRNGKTTVIDDYSNIPNMSKTISVTPMH